MRGKFITVEGIEGVGKSTIVPFVQETLESEGQKVHVTREPGGTELAEAVRGLLLVRMEGDHPSSNRTLAYVCVTSAACRYRHRAEFESRHICGVRTVFRCVDGVPRWRQGN